jgi:hypothetical protein
VQGLEWEHESGQGDGSMMGIVAVEDPLEADARRDGERGGRDRDQGAKPVVAGNGKGCFTLYVPGSVQRPMDVSAHASTRLPVGPFTPFRIWEW